MNIDDEDDLVLTPPEGMEADPEDAGDAGIGDAGADNETGEGDDDFAVEFEGEDAGAEETPLVAKLRQEIRERDKRLAEYTRTAKPKIEVGEKPTLESCEYDEERYEAELDGWKERKRQAEAQEQEAERESQARAERDQRAFVNYRARAQTLPVKDFDQAEQIVVNALPELHSRALLHYTKDPAKLVYALSQNPAQMERIGNEPDVIKAILMMAELEGKMKVTTRKKPPAPESESIQHGSARPSAANDRHLEKLEAQAAKTGDRSAIAKYRYEQRQQKRA